MSDDRIEIDCRHAAAESPLIVREACKLAWTAAGWPLQNMGFDQWWQLALLVIPDRNPQTLNLPANMRGVRRGDRVQIYKVTQSS